MRLTREEVEDWRRKIKDKIFSDFLEQNNEAHGKHLQRKFDQLCDLALLGLAQERNAIPDKDHNCPDQANMGEFACKSWANCWEPCGRLGHSEEHVKVAQEQNNAAPSIHVGTATTDLSQPRTWNAENVQFYVPAAPDAAPQDRTSGEQPSQLAGPAAAAPVDRIAELEAKIARMRPSEEVLEAVYEYLSAKLCPHCAEYRVGSKAVVMARELIRINEEAK